MPHHDRPATPATRLRLRLAALPALALVVAPLGGCMLGEAFAERGSPPAAVQAASLAPTAQAAPATPRPSDFQTYLRSLRPEARARGVSEATIDAAFAGLSPDQEVVRLTTRQSEFVRPIWDYLDGAVSEQRLRLGRQAAQRHAATLDSVERAHGVPKAIVLGIWGMETNFGSYTGTKDVFRSLATLAHAAYRGDFFQTELLAALEILQQGKIARAAMKGSWAGAMGHTQFMPTSYLRWAVDGDGDGRRDIWGSIPDALASAANYLRGHGWVQGLPWGMEVALPAGFDYAMTEASFSRWGSMGVRRAGGGALPSSGDGRLFLPAGANGPAFLVTANFDVIKRYNSSDAYALGVALLGDRLTGGGGLVASWPRNERMLDAPQRREVQERLQRLGHYGGTIDGMFGTQTREAVRSFQLQRGLRPDGYANLALLEALRAAR